MNRIGWEEISIKLFFEVTQSLPHVYGPWEVKAPGSIFIDVAMDSQAITASLIKPSQPFAEFELIQIRDIFCA